MSSHEKAKRLSIIITALINVIITIIITVIITVTATTFKTFFQGGYDREDDLQHELQDDRSPLHLLSKTEKKGWNVIPITLGIYGYLLVLVESSVVSMIQDSWAVQLERPPERLLCLGGVTSFLGCCLPSQVSRCDCESVVNRLYRLSNPWYCQVWLSFHQGKPDEQGGPGLGRKDQVFGHEQIHIKGENDIQSVSSLFKSLRLSF